MRSTPQIVRVPITNIFGGGDYTAQIRIGSQQAPANVILDTGSSTLAVKESAYDADKDTQLHPTANVQDVLYGTGGWAGPVVHTEVSLGDETTSVTLKKTHVAITATQQKGNFGMADGILGLAYRGLNRAYNLEPYLKKSKVDPPVTWP